MQSEVSEQVQVLQQEIVKLGIQRTTLEQANSRAAVLMQKLGNQLGWGAAGKLEWVDFKLAYQQEELARLLAEERGNTLSAPKTSPATETTRQKMERMVTENPLALEPHIRRVYEALLATE